MSDLLSDSRVATFMYGDKFLYVSPYFTELFSLTREEVLGMTFEDMLDKKSYEDINAQLKGFSKSSTLIIKTTINIILKSAEILSADIQLESFTDDHVLYGSFSNFTFQKITGTKMMAESFLRVSRLLGDNSMAMILIDCATNKISYANAAAAVFYGYDIEQLIDMPMANISELPEQILFEELTSARLQKKTFFISQHKLANGTIRDVNESINKIVIGGFTYLFDIITDITRRKLLEKQIEEKNKSLVELNVGLSKTVQDSKEEVRKKEQIFTMQAKYIVLGEIVNFIISDWKTPIKNIGLLVQDLEDTNNYGKLTADFFSQVVTNVSSQLDYMNVALDHISSFFSPIISTIDHDVYHMMIESIELLKWQLHKQSITCNLNCSCKGHTSETCGVKSSQRCPKNYLNIVCDKNECKQIMSTLFINSADAIVSLRKKGVILKDDLGLIFISIKCRDDAIDIEVADNGGGVDENALTQVFDPYFTTKIAGSGIGLFMTRLSIETMLNGTIQLENSGDGTKVTITIPK